MRKKSQIKNPWWWLIQAALLSLFTSAAAFCWADDNVRAQPVPASSDRRILFLGNEALPPMNYMKDGKPTGLVIDIVNALSKRMHRPVVVRLTNWTEAQRRVLDGQADALLQINSNPERLKIYDFSEPLLTSEFCIFTSSRRHDITTLADLRGLKVGVEENGLPILLLKDDPRIKLNVMPDYVQGFRMLTEGVVDALIADKWVGSFVLAENNIRGIRVIEEPISRSYSTIAVKKGNAGLLKEINAGLADIRRDGSYDRIIKSWQSMEVVFETREHKRQQKLLMVTISAALIVSLAVIVMLIREIQRRKRVEAALKQSEETLSENRERLQLFIEHAPAALAMFDRTMCYISASNRWCDDYGLGNRQLVGISHYEIFPEITARWKDIHQRGLSGEVVRAEEDLFERADGSIQWLRWAVMPWRNSAGQVGGIVIFTEDITLRKQAEEALKQSNIELEAANKDLEAFIYSVSHDLRAPLRAMAGFSKIMIEDYAEKLEPAGKDYLERIYKNGEKMSQLIDDLLRLSRLSRQEMERTEIDLGELAESVVLTMRDTYPGRTVNTIISNGVRASLDPNLMRIVLMNLFDNAWKFTEKTKNARIEFGCLQGDGKDTFFVKDNGAGFDQTQAERMFWPFHRLHSGAEFQGTGIGLAIVERIVQRHGGKVWAEGEVGKGATVYFTL
ncbi:MAG TPA: transporter substrate-binding domain-containing protein [Nitrospirota bacterium]|nr:transporter substrate-binding domain-containing protein [Nitrospirota bacterium]